MWSWNFGDGTTGSGNPITHTYTAPGTYTVGVTATNSGGSASNASAATVTVGSQPTVWKVAKDALAAVLAASSAPRQPTVYPTSSAWNSNNWLALAGVDTSAVMASPDSQMCVLISPLHVMGAHHAGIFGPVILRGSDGVFYMRGIVSTQRVGSTSDLRIGTLDSPFPAAVTPVMVAPANLMRYLDPAKEATLHCVEVSRNGGARTVGVKGVAAYAEPVAWWELPGNVPAAPDPALVYLEQGGDSGSPVMLLLPSGLVLLAPVHFAGGGGASVAAYADAIRAIVQAGGYDVTFPVLSGFAVLYP